MTAANLDRTLRATGKHTSEVQLLKFPLRPHKPSSSSSSAQEDEQQYEWRHRTLSLALAGPCEELPGASSKTVMATCNIHIYREWLL
jgi:hypothetical protein